MGFPVYDDVDGTKWERILRECLPEYPNLPVGRLKGIFLMRLRWVHNMSPNDPDVERAWRHFCTHRAEAYLP